MKLLNTSSIIITIGLIALLAVSCRRDKYELAPVIAKQTQGCDTLNFTYTASVKPILKNNCYSCHSSAVTETNGGLDLENFSSLKNYLNYFYRNDSIFGSKFSHIINQKGTVLFMPPTGKMTDCELSVISKWINSGAVQN